MLRIHVRLNLEHKAGELFLRRLYRPDGGFARGRRRRQFEKFAKERLDTEVGQRTAEEHRHQRAGENFVVIERMTGGFQQLEVVQQLMVRLGAKESNHLGAVDTTFVTGRPLRAMIIAAIEQVDPLLPTIEHTHERTVAMNRPRHGMTVDAEIRLHVAHQLERIFADTIAFVHKRKDRHAPALADLKQLARAILDAFAIVEQHHGAVGRHEGAVRVLRKVFVPRCVEQVDVEPFPIELHHARRHRDAALLFERHPVRRRMPLGAPRLHRSCKMNRTAVQQQLLGESRLACVRMADDRERPPPHDRAGDDGG